jgi:hypothetical protein
MSLGKCDGLMLDLEFWRILWRKFLMKWNDAKSFIMVFSHVGERIWPTKYE